MLPQLHFNLTAVITFFNNYLTLLATNGKSAQLMTFNAAGISAIVVDSTVAADVDATTAELK